MTDTARGQAAGSGTASPSPLSIRPRPQATADSGRATAKAVLGDALNGVELSAVDRRFISRLSQWDKRSAITLASLIVRARQAGRGEVMTPEQLGTVLDALMDAYAYRTSGAASAGCWDCANRASGFCAEHARDAGRANAFAELAATLAGAVSAAAAATDAAAAAATPPATAAAPASQGVTASPERARLDGVPGYRRRRAAVVS